MIHSELRRLFLISLEEDSGTRSPGIIGPGRRLPRKVFGSLRLPLLLWFLMLAVVVSHEVVMIDRREFILSLFLKVESCDVEVLRVTNN